MNFVEMIESLVKPLLNNQEGVQVKEISDIDDNLTVEILVNADDLGRVIGREGRVANAIRTIAYSAAIKEGKKIRINFDTLVAE